MSEWVRHGKRGVGEQEDEEDPIERRAMARYRAGESWLAAVEAAAREGGKARAPRRAVAGRSAVTAAIVAPRIQRSPEAEAEAEAVEDGAERDVAAPVLGTGRPLPESLRRQLERALGVELDGVRVHDDGRADEAARALGARAFAVGQDIGFRAGAYEPGTVGGRRLIAHEVAHTVQHRGGDVGGGVSRPSDPTEREAEAFADRFVASSATPTARGPAIRERPAARGETAAVQRETVEPELKKHANGTYSYKEDGKKLRWIEGEKIDFLKGAGFDVFLAARKKGYSTFGGLFVVAHASLESGWGQGNWASETHNLFSVMGGSNAKYKTKHGTLAKYASVSEAFDAYIALISRTDRWPTTTAKDTGLYYQQVFTPDDVNKAFKQKGYYPKKPGKDGYAYNADGGAGDYGKYLFDRMEWLAGPLIEVVKQMIADAPAEAASTQLLKTYLAELKTAYADVTAKLKDHAKTK